MKRAKSFWTTWAKVVRNTHMKRSESIRLTRVKVVRNIPINRSNSFRTAWVKVVRHASKKRFESLGPSWAKVVRHSHARIFESVRPTWVKVLGWKLVKRSGTFEWRGSISLRESGPNLPRVFMKYRLISIRRRLWRDFLDVGMSSKRDFKEKELYLEPWRTLRTLGTW